MLDLYCERLGPGLLAEPINAVTNLAFFVAAWAAWRMARRNRVASAEVLVLLILMCAIGLGSTLFHVFATPATRSLDLLPILLFQLAYIAVYGRRLAGIGHIAAFFLVAVYLVVALWARRYPEILNGSVTYLPALAVLFGLGCHYWSTRTTDRMVLLQATLVFCLSLTFRTMDTVVCSVVPIGTHFLWHLLNALVLYLAMKGLCAGLAAGPARTARSHPA
jgi:hypothetical protein